MFHEYSGVPMELLKKIAKDHQFQMFEGIIDTIVDGIRQEILNEEFVWKPIWYTHRWENGKLRRIGIQDIKQQLYDYIAVEGLAEVLRKKIGYYQCAAIPNKGQVMGMRAIKRWLRNKGLRYAWKGDARHYYENIDIDKLKELLERYVDNKLLLKLTYALIGSFEKGLSIGSYLSQYLANFYMSFAYHYSEELFKTRKHRNGTEEKVRLIRKQLFYMDDIMFASNSLKDLKMAVRRFRKWIFENLGITIKEEEEYIDLQTGYIDMMGFLISRKKVIVRPRIFRRYRKDIKKVRKTGEILSYCARRIMSRNGWLTNAQCRHRSKRNKADKIIKLSKEMISNGKNVIQLTAAGSKSNDSSKQEKRRNSSDKRRTCCSGKPHRGKHTIQNHDVSVRWKSIPDGVRADRRRNKSKPGKVSGVQSGKRTNTGTITA